MEEALMEKYRSEKMWYLYDLFCSVRMLDELSLKQAVVPSAVDMVVEGLESWGSILVQLGDMRDDCMQPDTSQEEYVCRGHNLMLAYKALLDAVEGLKDGLV